MTPREAWASLSAEPASLLVDLRSLPEWQFVGVPDLRGLGKAPVFLSWQAYPEMSVRRDFAEALENEGVGRDRPILLLCRAGDRAATAARALLNAGYVRASAIDDGFEGPPDAQGRRGHLRGWKAEGLPWAQQ